MKQVKIKKDIIVKPQKPKRNTRKAKKPKNLEEIVPDEELEDPDEDNTPDEFTQIKTKEL